MLVDTNESSTKHPLRPAIHEITIRGLTLPLSDGLKFVAIMMQLVLLAVLIKRYNVESPAFFQLTLLAFGGFAVHYFLPMAFRMPFFLALSLAGIVMVMGPVPAAWLISMGLTLVALCHLPLPFWTRVTILVATGVLLAGMRAGWVSSILPLAVWPILSSMFMFRMIVYLYDLHHGRGPKSWSQSLSYFFMLPNVCFPLFPIVDFQAFTRRYFAGDRYEIYQVGVHWIFRGIMHLILYRMLYNDWAISLYEVENAGDVMHYCLWSFLLYLRVSGQFHVIVGILHLFGFNLPETHHLYYLDSSFTDVWRRINIYWKDFMMRIVFYPAYFRFRKFGTKGSFVAATICVFFTTWLFHSIQWFWFRGSLLISFQDILFYSILGGFVIYNSLSELKHGQKSIAGTSWRNAFMIGARTVATFLMMCILWSMWTSDSLADWLLLWPSVLVPPTRDGWLLIVGTVVVIMGSAVFLARKGHVAPRRSFERSWMAMTAGMVFLSALSVSAVNRQLGAPGRLIASAQKNELNRAQMEQLERGYYENLLAVDRFNGDLWTLYMKRPPVAREWTDTVLQAGLADPTNDILRYELKPLISGRYRGTTLRTNRWGMHDKEYTLKRPDGCYRMALMGASPSMGLGVQREETFEAVLEDRLNRDHPKSGGGSAYEILNFSVTGYRPLRQIWVLQDKVLRFEPNVLIYAGHHGDANRVIEELSQAVRDRIELPDASLRNLVKQIGVTSDTPEVLIKKKLKPRSDELLSWVFQRMVEICRAHEIKPVYILMLTAPGQKGSPVEVGPDLELAEKAGFQVIDLSDAFDGYSWRSLWISDFDTHANVLGHQLLAARLYERLRQLGIIPAK
jgi:hypothetical protein